MDYSRYGYPKFYPETLSEAIFGPGYDIAGQPVVWLRWLIDDTLEEEREVKAFIKRQELLERRRI